MERAFAQAVRGRAIGVQAGTLIGCGWAAWGLAPATGTVRTLIGLPAAAVAIALLSGARRLFAIARALPRPEDRQRTANRRVWTLFWVNVAVEIVLLNGAVALLDAPAARIYWIPAISFVVGLHFIPMASFFRAPSYGACAAAMMAVAIGVAVAIAGDASTPRFLVSLEALLNATILWATAAWGLRTVSREHPDGKSAA